MSNAPGLLIDTNVYVSRWPLRRIAGDDTAGLLEMLRRHGVVQAWAGSFDGVFHKDVAAVNARLAEECRTCGRVARPGGRRAWLGARAAQHAHRCALGVPSDPRGEDLLLPFGTAIPRLPDWGEDLRRCHEEHRMPGIRLHANYHGYTLDDPAFVRLLEMASGSKKCQKRCQEPFLRSTLRAVPGRGSWHVFPLGPFL